MLAKVNHWNLILLKIVPWPQLSWQSLPCLLPHLVELLKGGFSWMTEHREISLLFHLCPWSYSGQGHCPPASCESQLVLSSLSLFANWIQMTTHPSLETFPSFSDMAALRFGSHLSVLLWSYCGLVLPVLKRRVIFLGLFSSSRALSTFQALPKQWEWLPGIHICSSDPCL